VPRRGPTHQFSSFFSVPTATQSQIPDGGRGEGGWAAWRGGDSESKEGGGGGRGRCGRWINVDGDDDAHESRLGFQNWREFIDGGCTGGQGRQ
jgi:hypothetical protein